MARKVKQTYIEKLRNKTYQELHIELEYWKTLESRYLNWGIDYHYELQESRNSLKKVELAILDYEQNFLDNFKKECPYMAHAVTLDMAKDYLQKYASINALFKPSADLFKDYLLSNEIIKMEDIEL